MHIFFLKKYGDENDTNRIHPVVALGGCNINCHIVIADSSRFSSIYGTHSHLLQLLSWIVLGVIFYFCSRKKFMVVTKREMDYLILGNVQVVRGVRKGQKQSDIVQGNIVNPK